MKQITFALWLGMFATLPALADAAPRLEDSLKLIRAVGPEGKGNADAGAAWKLVAAADAGALPVILAAMDGANDLAVNWLRAGIESIAARERAAARALPVATLEKFIHDTRHNPHARRLAYELIERADAPRAANLLAGLRDDPSSELRRDAVQRLVDEAGALTKAGKSNAATPIYLTALQSAREADQVEGIAHQLKKLGHPVDLPNVFGWLSHWHVIGPFDNTGRKGFEQVFPPEKKIDLRAELDGKLGEIHWQDYHTVGDYGLVDLNKPCGTLKEVTGYAFTEFVSDRARSVELRLGCKDGWKIWLNGKYLFGRDEYHRGAEIDQYRLAGELKKGRNTILVKLCQNEQKEDWTKEWEFQLRITDALGTPVREAAAK